MSKEFYTSILKQMNQCYHTGVEQAVSVDSFGESAVVVYQDHVGNYRTVLISESEPVAGILFDYSGECRVRYTQPEKRGQKLTKQLFAWMCWKFPKMNFRHSDNMTEAGRSSV